MHETLRIWFGDVSSEGHLTGLFQDWVESNCSSLEYQWIDRNPLPGIGMEEYGRQPAVAPSSTDHESLNLDPLHQFKSLVFQS